MPLDPYLAERLHLLDGVARTFEGAEDPRSRERQDAFLVDPAPWVQPPVDVRDATVAGRHGPVPVRTYRPARTSAVGSLVWAHGGGFARGELDWNEAHVVGAELAARAGVLVVSVDYRLARDGVRFPVPVDDVVDVWAWLHADPERPPGRAVLGGASAGAALAMAAALRVRDEGAPPDDLLLAYPFAHFPVPALDDDTAAEMARLPAALRFTPASIEAMVQGYVGRISDVPPLALPGHADVGGLPRTHVLVSEYDDLRPSGELLERQLRACGVPVRSYLAAGMLHGHLNRTPALAEVSRSLDFFAEALRG
jgi:acetyl esterase/lipase